MALLESTQARYCSQPTTFHRPFSPFPPHLFSHQSVRGLPLDGGHLAGEGLLLLLHLSRGGPSFPSKPKMLMTQMHEEQMHTRMRRHRERSANRLTSVWGKQLYCSLPLSVAFRASSQTPLTWK